MIAQMIAIAIFFIMFVLIATEKVERHIVSLISGALMLILVFGLCMQSTSAIMETLNIHGMFRLSFWYRAGQAEEASSGINWATILFIAGMMIMVEGMGRAGFFRFLCLWIAKVVKYKAIPILITFMLMAFGLSMFIDSITVILFLAAVTIELAQLLKFNPVPMILSEIFCANLGGSATMCGDPPNIIIGTSLGYTFGNFIVNTGVIALLSLAVIVLYFYLCFRKELKLSEKARAETTYPSPKEVIRSRKDLIVSSMIFACAVILLITHAQTGLTVASIGVLIGILSLISQGKEAKLMIKMVDYKTLLFFIGLFVVVGGLEQTGILGMIAGLIARMSGDNLLIMLAIVLWISAAASAFVDNIPFAATMIPVIKTLSQTLGVDLSVLAWTLAIGTDIGGSATPIGASANVVGISIAGKSGYAIGWGKYCRYMAPATILVVLISMLFIYVRYAGIGVI